MTPKICYRDGYKYQLKSSYGCATGIIPPKAIDNHEFIVLSAQGFLSIWAGYAWDGPSGPTIDTKNFMRGSLEHDAFYQLLREGLLSPDFRKQADERLRTVCREDGMSAIRAWWVYQGVRLGGSAAAKPSEPKLLVAP